MTRSATIYTATADDISAIDLRDELSGIASRGEVAQCYTATVYDDETTAPMGADHDLQIVWMPEIGRVGICTNGTSDWADYGTVDAAVHDYLNDWDAFEARN